MAATGDFALAMPQDGVSIAFAPHDHTIWSVDGGSSQATPVIPGSVLIHSNRNFVWHYREKESEWIYIELEPQVLTRIAQESGLSTDLEKDKVNNVTKEIENFLTTSLKKRKNLKIAN